MSFKTTLGKLLDHRRTVVHLNGYAVDQIRYLRMEEGKHLYRVEVCDGTDWYFLDQDVLVNGTDWYFLDQDVLVNSTGGVYVDEYPCFENGGSTWMALLTFRTLKPVTQSDLEKLK